MCGQLDTLWGRLPVGTVSVQELIQKWLSCNVTITLHGMYNTKIAFNGIDESQEGVGTASVMSTDWHHIAWQRVKYQLYKCWECFGGYSWGSFGEISGPSSAFGYLCSNQLLRCWANLVGTEGEVTAMAATQGMCTASIDSVGRSPALRTTTQLVATEGRDRGYSATREIEYKNRATREVAEE